MSKFIAKRLLFYAIVYLSLSTILIVAVFIAKRSLYATYIYIQSHLYPLFSIMTFTFIMLYATGMVSYYRRRKSTWKSFNILQLIGFTLLSVFIASGITSILFYSSRIERSILLYNSFLLSLFFIFNAEHFLKTTIKNTTTYIWKCRKITPEELYTLYEIHIPNLKYTISEDDTPENTIIIYDDENIMKDVELMEKLIEGFSAMSISELVELEAGLVPYRFITDFYRISDFTKVKYFSDGAKVIFDFLFAPLLLLVLFPVSFLFAMLHKIESPGPIFYQQIRAGKNGKPFKLIKFRTMIKNAEKHGRKFASKNDPRVTRIGRIMRKLRLDEVPQLINVVRGEMSLIGPRPERPEFIEQFSKQIPFYRLRLEIKPGLTGWAQVHYKYTGPKIEEQIRKLEYDLYYIKNRNILLDIIVLLKTIGVVLKAEGV